MITSATKSLTILLALLSLSVSPLVAEQFGLFTYRASAERVTITGYPSDATGDVQIPETIDGVPVTIIEAYAFSKCTEITSVSIGDSVTSIGERAFSDCASLNEINVSPLNPHYTSLDGVLFWEYMENLIHYPTAALIHYPAGKAGDYTIPDTVSEIELEAFSGCTKLTSVFIPDSVISIYNEAFSGCINLKSVHIPGSVIDISSAFYGCTGLASINVSPLNRNYSSLDGVFFNKEKTTLIQYPAEKSGGYIVPDSVTSINSRTVHSGWRGAFYSGQGAFEGCYKLTGISIPDGVTTIGAETFRGCSALKTVTIPAGLTEIGNLSWRQDDLTGAFEDCTSLHSINFLGDAPEKFDENTLRNTAPDFTLYYLSSSTGFTSPTWKGYSIVMIDESRYPAAPWLLKHGHPYATDLHQDLNGDGNPLFMAYALNLDPDQNLQRKMPAPVLDGDSLSLSFHAVSPGITYTVETSTDLDRWTSEGVTQSPPDTTGQGTATVTRDTPTRFLRLVVQD